jgi:hypothetical protein
MAVCSDIRTRKTYVNTLCGQNVEFLSDNSVGIYSNHWTLKGDQGDTVVRVLCYKSEDLWFDRSWCNWNFSLT